MKELKDLGVMDLVSSKDIPPLIPTDPAANADERKDSGEVQGGSDTAIRKTPSAEDSEKLEEGARNGLQKENLLHTENPTMSGCAHECFLHLFAPRIDRKPEET